MEENTWYLVPPVAWLTLGTGLCLPSGALSGDHQNLQQEEASAARLSGKQNRFRCTQLCEYNWMERSPSSRPLRLATIPYFL